MRLVPKTTRLALIDTDDRCVDPKRYSARLKQLYDCTADSFFDWGKNEALSLDAPKRLSRLQKRKLDCIRILEEYKDDAGVTEDDVSYMKGYLEGLNLAIEVYRELQNEEFEASVALIDHFGLLAQMGGEKEAFNSTFVKCNATINAKIFPTLDSANETGVIYDDYYLICSKRLSDAKEDLIYQIQLDFYKATGKTFHLLDLEKNLKSELFSNLFTFDKEKDE